MLSEDRCCRTSLGFPEGRLAKPYLGHRSHNKQQPREDCGRVLSGLFPLSMDKSNVSGRYLKLEDKHSIPSKVSSSRVDSSVYLNFYF